MVDRQQRERFQELRQRAGSLTEAEKAEMALLVQALEDGEAAYLASATSRLRQEREIIESQNRTLGELAKRKDALVLRLRDFLAETRAEKQAIDGELAAVLGGSRDPHTDG